MKKKCATGYKKIKKFDAGTQVLNANVDPTTQYQTNRKDVTAKDMQFNNAQQSLLNRDITQQRYADAVNKVNTDYSSTQQSKAATNSAVASGLGAIPGIGKIAAAGYGLGTSTGEGFNQKSMNQAVATGKGSNTDKQLATMFTPTSSKLLNAKNGADVAEAFIPIHGLFGKTSQDKAEDSAIQAKKRQEFTNNQIANYGAVDTTSQAVQAKDGSSGIHIKPENKGKFTAYKKRTGKTTEEALHSKNPHVRQMANFARNAAKWNKKEDGVEALGGGQQLYKKTHYKTKKKGKDGYNDFPNDIIKNKSIMEKGTRKIETEGREPIFSPKKKDGTRDLLYYNPEDPTHSQGGVPAKVVSKDKYKMKKGSPELIIPEGSAIVTANKGKNKEALKAYKKGDYKKLDKVINQMPSDNSKKKLLGSDDLGLGFEDKAGNKYKYNNNANTRLTNNNPSDKWGSNVPAQNLSFNTNTPTTTPVAKDRSNILGSATGTIAGLAPTIYNLGQGIFGKTQQTNRRYINNEAYKYKDTSNPNRRAANEQFRVEADNIRNASGGSGSSFLANQSLASANRFKNISDINNQEAAKRVNIKNANTDLRNQQNQANLGLANQYDEQDAMNRGKKSEFIAKGLEGLSQASQMNQLNNNRAKADNTRMNLLKTGNYTIDKDGNITPKAKKGLKNIKYKMKQ